MDLTSQTVAEWLANRDGDGASDVEFAETFVLWYKLQSNKENGLSIADMNQSDPAELCDLIKNILNEIIFGIENNTSAWWKQPPDEET